MSKSTSIESIEVKREAVPTYPVVAIRELTANIMVHQDTAVTGMPLTIEIFTNRLTFTNPGACLLYEDGLSINNQIVRERFNLNTKQSVMASRILSDTLESGLIKMKNPETESKRYTSYIPFYG